MQIKK